MKTPYCSYYLNNIPKGCKFCVKGEKLVLFISGKCSRNCWYCSLSKKRKNVDKTWANEREIKNTKELIEEIRASNARGAGITGGDPLLNPGRTLKYVRALKKINKKFHIHIYLPTKLVNINNLRQLSKYIDEVRFHPEFLIDNSDKDVDKIKLASLFWKKENIGIELPLLPDKKYEIIGFIKNLENDIGFVNLNEFELSETNYNLVTKKYKLNQGGYTIKGSIEAGLWILKELRGTKLRIHLCTAELKNNWQFKNRLKRHKIMKYGKRTEDGTVIHLVVEYKNNADKNKLIKKINKCYVDEAKKRLIIHPSEVNKLMKYYKIFRIEEYPTWDRYEVEKEEL